MDGHASYRRHAASMSSSTLPRFTDPASQDMDSLWFIDSQLLQQGTDGTASGFDQFRSAHDDLCIEDPKCPGMLPHGDASAAFHRSNAGHMGYHDRQSFSADTMPNVPNWLQFGDPFGQAITSDLPKYFPNQDMAGSQQFLFNSPTLEEPASQPPPRRKPVDHDQSSVCNSICDSSCGDGEKCHGTSCADAESVCSDENCLGVDVACTDCPEDTIPCTEADCPDAKAAVALTSFVGMDTDHNYEAQNQSLVPTHPIHDTRPGSYLSSEFMNKYQHIFEAHNPHSPTCTSSCPVNDPSFYQRCYLPHTHMDFGDHHLSNASMNHFDIWDAGCGAELPNGEAMIEHCWEQHGLHLDVPPMTPSIADPSQVLSTFSSARASPMTLDTTPLSHHGFPSPLTPIPNTFEMQPKVLDMSSTHTHMDIVPPSRPSTACSAKFIPSQDEQTKCFWCDHSNGSSCGQSFATPEDLHEHVKEAHIKSLKKGPEGFLCCWQTCDRRHGDGQKAFTQKSKIERHMQTHTGVKPFKCKVCGDAFSAKQALRQHELIHTGETPLQCPFEGCKRSFRQQSALTMHIRTHTGDKPLKCEICGKAFSESSNLSKHRRTHQAKGSYVCSFEGCGKDFNRLDQLRRHWKQHGGAGEPPLPAVSAGTLHREFGGVRKRKQVG